MLLNNKIAIVTGGSKGIGREIALMLSREGVNVIINYLNDDKSAKLVLNECDKYSKNNSIYKADVSNENSIDNLIKFAKEKYGTIDILINNAGIYDEKDNPNNIEVFEKIIKVNFLGPVMVTKHALEILKSGKIINISSVHGILGHGSPTGIAYGALKSALDHYTKSLAKDLAPNILVNGVAPGRTYTPMWGEISDKEKAKLGEVKLIKRMIEPEEIADGVLFLLKNDAVCGEILVIDGGMTLKTLG